MNELERSSLNIVVREINDRIRSIKKLYKQCEYHVEIKALEQNADGMRTALFLMRKINMQQNELIRDCILSMKIIDTKELEKLNL